MNRHRLSLWTVGLFPTTTQRFIELDKALVFVVSCLRQGEFGIEKRPLAIKDLEIIRRAASIAHERHVDRFLKILNRLFLALADSVVFVIANQGVRNIAERALNGLLVADQGLPSCGLRVAQIVAQVATLENRLRTLAA